MADKGLTVLVADKEACAVAVGLAVVEGFGGDLFFEEIGASQAAVAVEGVPFE